MNENYQIRAAQIDEVPQIINLIKEFAEYEKLADYCEITADILRDALFGANSCIEGLVAANGDALIGYALFCPYFASFRGQRGLYLEDIYIRKEFRGRQIGAAMIKHLAKIAKNRGCVRIDFQVLEWNTPAIEFYKKHGADTDESERHFKFTDAAFEKLSE